MCSTLSTRHRANFEASFTFMMKNSLEFTITDDTVEGIIALADRFDMKVHCKIIFFIKISFFSTDRPRGSGNIFAAQLAVRRGQETLNYRYLQTRKCSG